MPLNDLDVNDLGDLANSLTELHKAVADLSANGFDPRVSLTPGEAVTITLRDFAMPDLDAVIEDLFAPTGPVTAHAPAGEESVEEGIARIDQTNSADPSRSEDGAAGVSAAQGDDAPPKTSPALTEGLAESGGGQASAAATPPVASDSVPEPSANRGLSKPWTAEEDAQLIDLIVTGMLQQGLGKRAAMEAAAPQLGRPVPGTVFRASHALQERVNLALAAWRKVLSPNAGVTAPSKGEAAVEGQTLTAVQDRAPAVDRGAVSRAAAIEHGNGPEAVPVGGPVWAHVTGLTRRDGWTLQRDIDLLELAILGWLGNEISLELGVEAKLIKPRLDLLTGLFTDDAGKQARRFTRETVLSALKALQANKAA